MILSKRDANKYSCFTKYSLFLCVFLIILILVTCITTMVLANQQDDIKRSIQIINPRPDFSLSLRLDKGTGATYAPGERIQVFFRSTRNAYVTIFGYDTQGNIRLLFPNQYQRNNFIQANREYSIERGIEAGARPGIEYVQGFATTEPALITRELERRIAAEYLPIIGEGFSRFTERIRGILTGLPAQRWVSSEVLHYQVVETRAETGQLRLISAPDGADVYLNDRYAGKTPLFMERLQAREYLARVEKPGYHPWSRTIRINPNRTTFITADLQIIPQYGSIAIRSNQDNARIYLDGQYKGLTQRNRDIMLERVTPGYHDIRVTLSGYRDWQRRIEVQPNQRVQLTVNLERIVRTGTLEITSNVDNARIYLDGNYRGLTSSRRSVTIRNIQEGNYQLRVVRDGYQDYVATIRIYPEEVNRINVRMQPELRRGAIALYSNENNARIFINGVYKATTSTIQARIFDELEEGVYEITVIKDGFWVWLEETRVFPGETTSIFADLVRIDN